MQVILSCLAQELHSFIDKIRSISGPNCSLAVLCYSIRLLHEKGFLLLQMRDAEERNADAKAAKRFG